MRKTRTKIGFTKFGGIFIGRGICSDPLSHYAITVLISFDEPFELLLNGQPSRMYRIAIIQKNVQFAIKSETNTTIAFIHIMPHSEIGMRLSDPDHDIKEDKYANYDGLLPRIRRWYKEPGNNEQEVQAILEELSFIPRPASPAVAIDTRIMKSLQLIMENESEKIPVAAVAGQVNLSVSQFQRIFRKETGLSFRRFVLHTKLIRSIRAMHDNHNLTSSSFQGGFADQAHLTRTFRKNFGIRPSESL